MLTSNWLCETIISLTWPGKSPDLNPIKNILGIISRYVYADGKQNKDKETLQSAVQDCWAKIPDSVLPNLAKSMNDRCVEVHQSGEKTLNY